MSALEGIWGLAMLGLGDHPYRDEAPASELEPDDPEARITYGGFIFMLQKLGINLFSLSAFQFAMLVGKGTYFSVYRVRVCATNYQSLSLVISKPETPLFRRSLPPMNTYVAFKRMKIRDDSSGVEISDPGQLYAISREIQALTHPILRDHDSIIKLQAIVWENGFGAGNQSDLPMWPTLVLEYCETTLADFQVNNPPLPIATRMRLISKIGAGLEALHGAHIIHGDLKTENVLLKTGKECELEPKLADFGCSLLLEKSDARKKYWIGGTEMWCAPECPGYFTTWEDMEMTDFYSFGLLMWKVNLDGINPFEKLGMVPSEWSENAKLREIRSLKENDRVSSLYRESLGKDVPKTFGDNMAGFLLKDPLRRRKAVEETSRVADQVLAEAVQRLKAGVDNPNCDGQSTDIMNLLEDLQGQLIGDSDSSESVEEEHDPFELFSFGSLISGRSFIPDCAKLSEMSPKLELNAVTRSRIFEEIVSILDEETGFAYPQKCTGCLKLTRIDTEPHTLTPETLLQELQRYLSNDTGDKHSCPGKLYASNKSDRHMSFYGISDHLLNSEHARKRAAIYQLYLANCAGFGTEKNLNRALKILEDGMTSGYSGCSVLFCLLSSFLNRRLPSGVPFRKWLTILILCQSGIPSEPFRVLRDLDPSLALLVSAARSKVYNGSTASFENMKFNAICCRNGDILNVSPRFLEAPKGSLVVQEEFFENTLLHLVAGSDNSDTNMLEYCISILGIDKDVRNADGATPLLMACRAGRREKIMALLHLNADVNLNYVGGETPLHWLSLLPNPMPVLKEFLRRGADINAQITQLRALPNFNNFHRGFYMYGSPLVWAMSLGNALYVDALIDQGANIHLESVIGFTPIQFACRPNNSQYLSNLARATGFQIVGGDIYSVLLNWSTISIFRTLGPHQSQEEALELLLSTPLPIYDVESLLDFYRFLIPKAVDHNSPEVLQILLNSLCRSTQDIRKMDLGLDIDAKRPLSHPFWTNSYLTHNAAARGNAKILSLVLSYGGDVTSIDGFGRSTLHSLSLSSNNRDCGEVLAKHGALSVLDRKTSPEGLTAFGLAVASCNFAVADGLLEYTPETERQKILSSQPASELFFPDLSFFGHFVVMAATLGEKPLEYLCKLPEVRANVDRLFIVDAKHGISALMLACGLRSEYDIYDTDWFAKSKRRRAMKVLLQTFSEERHRDAKDCSGNTALHAAAFVGSSDMAGVLLEDAKMCDINPVNKGEATPLDMVYQSDPPFVETLKEPCHKTIIQNYEKGRNQIREHLRDLGAVHNLRSLTDDPSWTDDRPPFPRISGMRILPA